MQSKTSYFNPTQFKKNLTRFWPLWGGASLLGVLAPLALLVEMIQAGFDVAVKPLEMTHALYSTLAYIVPVVSLLYAVLCALAVWHYLYNARSVSLYHSLPITRRGLFLTNFLSGMAMMLIPYAVTGALTILVFALAGCFEPAGILVTILGVIGDSFFFFAFATFVAFITGNPFACAAFYLIFNFFFAAAEMLVSILMTEFYFGVNRTYDGVLAFLSPVIFMTQNVGVSAQSKEVVTPDGWIDYGNYEFVRLQNGWVIGVYALVGLALMFCAWLLYKRRRSESAGDVVAVGWMKPVFRYGVALCSGLAGGEMLYQILFEGFEKGSTANAAPMAFCMAIAGVIGYYIASMLLAKSIKVFRGGTWKGAVGTAIAAAVLCGAIVLDPAGLESWVPSAGELESINYEFHGQWGGYVSASVKDPATIEKILDLHKTIIAEKDLLDHENYDSQIIILNYLDTDGKIHHRYYDVYCERDAVPESMIKSAQLACDPVIQEDNIFRNIKHDNIISSRLTGGYIDYLYNMETKEYETRDLSREEAQILEDAIRRDIAAGHFGMAITTADYNEYMETACRGKFELNYNITYQINNSSEKETRNDSTGTSINISTHCTETLDALKQIGVTDETHKILTRAEFQKLTKDEDMEPDYYYDDYYDSYVEYPEAVCYD